jgi:amidase
MTFDEYRQYDALGLAALVKKKEVHPRELLALALARADQTDQKIGAMVRRLDDMARLRCEQPFDNNAPFAGVPFVVKDLFQDIQGIPTMGGCAALSNSPSFATSDVVTRWQQAGLVIFGKSKTPEFGARNVTEPVAFGPARNPWDLDRTPGGSSGGSASLVASGVLPVAGANDGGGSIRIPAAACGLFGLKAGRGRISMGPAMAEGMFGAAVQGVVSRSVRDTAAMMDVLQVPDTHAPFWMPAPEQSYLSTMTQPPGRLRIGYCSESPVGGPVDPQAEAAMQDAIALLTSLGHEVVQTGQPVDGKSLTNDFLLTWFCMMAQITGLLKTYYNIPLSALEPDTQAMVAAGRSVSAVELLNCLHRWNEYNLVLTHYFQQYDMWLSPTLNGPARRIGELQTPKPLQMLTSIAMHLGLSGLVRKTPQFEAAVLKNLAWTPYTQLANLTGRPSMSVPLYWTPTGLPLGVQFTAPLNGEARLLQLAAQLEEARPWFNRVPAL